MKFLFLLLLFSFGYHSNAQLLKKIGDKVKRDAEWRVRYKADRQVDKALDSIIAAPKKIIDKKKNKNDNKTVPISDGNNKENVAGNLNSTASGENDMTPKDGFITLQLSATTVFSGGTLLISGESVKYKSLNQVEVTISGPATKDVKPVTLTTDGKYTTGWYAYDKAGEYIVTAKSSDKKSFQSAKFTVYKLPGLENWCDENIAITKKAYDKLKDEVDRANGSIGSKDKAELQKKIDEVKENVDAAIKLFQDLNTAGKDIAKLAKSGKNLSPNLAGNLSELNNTLEEQRKKMKQIDEFNNHEPPDNTICEYLVMINEACAAFSVYTNIECLAIKGIIKNITLDKGVPTLVGTMVNNRLPPETEFTGKECSKIFATSLFDAESLSTKLGKAGFAGDLVQFATDVLMRKYCSVFKGSFSHNYTIEFRNSKGQNWWTYGVEMKAVLFLRYPKGKIDGNIIKMKGNLEGNATKFSFFEDVEKEDGFQEGTKGKIEVVPIKTFMPLAVSVATSERDVLGFGAIARGMATPASFNILIDAEYDVDADKIKIFVNQALLDFTIYVSNKFVFLLVGADLLPYIKQMNFPIHQALVTISSVLRSHNEFSVDKDSKGNLSFTGKGNKHLGDKSSKIEHDLNFTISAKKD